MRQFGFWGHLPHATGPDLWSKYILIHFLICIYVISNKIDIESVYYGKVYLKTGRN